MLIMRKLIVSLSLINYLSITDAAIVFIVAINGRGAGHNKWYWNPVKVQCVHAKRSLFARQKEHRRRSRPLIIIDEPLTAPLTFTSSYRLMRFPFQFLLSTTIAGAKTHCKRRRVFLALRFFQDVLEEVAVDDRRVYLQFRSRINFIACRKGDEPAMRRHDIRRVRW